MVSEALLHPVEGLFCLRHGLGGSPLFGGHGCRDGFAQFRLHMEEVRRVGRAKVLCHIRQQPRRLVARRLDHVALQRSQGLAISSFQVS